MTLRSAAVRSGLAVVVLVRATELLLCRGMNAVWYGGLTVLWYWYWPLRCYCVVRGILDKVTPATQSAMMLWYWYEPLLQLDRPSSWTNIVYPISVNIKNTWKITPIAGQAM